MSPIRRSRPASPGGRWSRRRSARPGRTPSAPRSRSPTPTPRSSGKSFIVADGFEVNLFAADPLLAKPIQMNFDPAGRLWVASSEVYPQIKPGQAANDKVAHPRRHATATARPTRPPSSPTAC